MSRVGKIARLPEQIREQINLRLENGGEGRDIIRWLNSVDEVKAVLAEKFEGRPVNDGNLSQWKQGGFRDWQAQQTALEEARRVAFEGAELGQAGDNALADKLALWLTGRYVVATRKLLEAGDSPEAWKLLRELCHDLAVMRRGDHGAEWLRLERDRLKLHEQKQQRDREKLKEEIRKENPPPAVLSDEEQEKQWCQIFGFDPGSHPMLQKRNSFTPAPDPAGSPAPPPEEASSEDTDPLPPGPSLPPTDEELEMRELQRVIDLANAGDPCSEYNLGARYRDGFGVPKDLAKAREWLGRAASQGIGSAKIELNALVMRYGD